MGAASLALFRSGRPWCGGLTRDVKATNRKELNVASLSLVLDSEQVGIATMVTAREGAGSVVTFPVSPRKAARQRAAEMPRSLYPRP
jgi:hypothetical protein